MATRRGGWSLAIDLGTCRTAAATAGGGPGAAPAVLPVGDGGESYLGSPVCLGTDGRLLTGQAASAAADRWPERAERGVRRALVEQEQVLLGGRPVPTVDLAAAVLSRVLARAQEAHGGTAPARTVLTHPAHWTPRQVDRLRDAAVAAGVAEPGFLAEPLAAAHCYREVHGLPDAATGGELPAGARVAVHDLGGTFTAAVLAWDGREFTVERAGAQEDLGGADLDECLRGLLAERAADRDPGPWQELWEGTSPDTAAPRAALHRTLAAAREALSAGASTDVPVPGYAEPFLVRRREFEAAAEPVVERGYEVLAELLRRDGREPGGLAAVLLAGGAGRTPLVSDLIAARTGRLPLLAPDPKAVVVLGALGRQEPAAGGTQPGPAAGGTKHFVPHDPGFEF